MDGCQYNKKKFNVSMNGINKPICFRDSLIEKYGADCRNRGKKCGDCCRVQGKFTCYEPKKVIKLELEEKANLGDKSAL